MKRLFDSFRRMKLQQRLVLNFSILIILPMFFLGFFSYHSSATIINKNSEEFYRSALSQLAKEYNTVFSDAESLSYNLIGNEDLRYILNAPNIDAKYMEAYKRLYTLGDYATKSQIFSLSISKGGNIVYQSGAKVLQEEDNQWRFKAEVLKGKVVWSSIYVLDNLSGGPSVKVISLYREIMDLDRNVPIGMIRISISEDTLSNLYKGLFLGDQSEIFVIDKDGIIVSHPNKDFIGKPAPEQDFVLKFKDSTGFHSKVLNDQKVAYSYRITDSNYSMIGIVPMKTMYYESDMIRSLIMFTFAGCLLFVLILGSLLSRRISAPIKMLSEKMNEVEEGNFDASVCIDAQDEMGNLANHFNLMILKIKTLIRDLYEVKIKEREAELKALQEQINPHFLYNTLDTIRWTARKNKDFETSEYIEVLSRILRHNLNNGCYDTDIGSEIAHLKDYIFLQEKRYKDKLGIYINIDKSLYKYKIIKLVLQPIVENAIKHGFSPRLDGGFIFIDGAYADGTIKITVADNGVGADEKAINEIIHSQKKTDRVYALKNIHERIQFNYGEKYGLYFNSTIDKGSTVQIVIPAIEQEVGNNTVATISVK